MRPEGLRAGRGGILGEGLQQALLPNRKGIWGSVVSSPSGVRGKATEKCGFGAFQGLKNQVFHISQLVGRFPLLGVVRNYSFYNR